MPVCLFELNGFIVDMGRSMNALKAVSFVRDFIEKVIQLIGNVFDLNEGKGTN